MKNHDYQKYYFIETFLQYPTLSNNEILLSLIKKFELRTISYTKDQFSKFKKELNQKHIYNRTINEILNEIKLYGKHLLLCNMNYNDIQVNKY